MSHENVVLPKDQMAALLPEALRVALGNYQSVSGICLSGEENIKKISEREDACRKSLAHIQLLLKLAILSGVPDASAKDHNNQIVLSAMLQEAQEEVDNYTGEDGIDA